MPQIAPKAGFTRTQRLMLYITGGVLLAAVMCCVGVFAIASNQVKNDAAISATETAQPTVTATPCPNDVCPTNTPIPPTSTRTSTPAPTRTDTPAPTATPTRTDTPAPTTTPTSLTMADFHTENANDTSAQWDAYVASIKGTVVRWSGTVDTVASDGSMRVTVHENSFTSDTADFTIPTTDVLNYSQNEEISFTGKIADIQNFLGFHVTLDDVKITSP